MSVPIIYRGFEIREGGYWGWEWSHPDYDGPGDNRCGDCGSLEMCKIEIDNWFEMNEEDAR